MNLLKAIERLDNETAKQSLAILPPLEREVLERLIRARVALTSHQIVVRLVDYLFTKVHDKIIELAKNDLIEDHKMYLCRVIKKETPEKSEKTKIRMKPTFKLQTDEHFGDIEVGLFEDTFYPGPKIIKLGVLLDAFNNYIKEQALAKTETELSEAKKKLLMSLDVKIPSFRRLDQTILPELVALGLVISYKPTTKRKEKELYAVNPKLLALLAD